MKRLLMSVAVLAAAMTPAFAYDWADYEATRGEVEIQAYLQGVGEGVGWAIAFADAEQPIFCAPDDKAHNRAEYIQILEDFVAANPSVKEYPVEMILLVALQAKYPC